MMMIVCNISLKIDPGVEKDWIEWNKKEHIPDVLSTGFFPSNKKYLEEFAPIIRERAFQKWENKFITLVL